MDHMVAGAARRRPWPAAAGGGARWSSGTEGEGRGRRGPGSVRSSPRSVMAWTARPGRAGRRRDGARTAAAGGGEGRRRSASIRRLPARFLSAGRRRTDEAELMAASAELRDGRSRRRGAAWRRRRQELA